MSERVWLENLREKLQQKFKAYTQIYEGRVLEPDELVNRGGQCIKCASDSNGGLVMSKEKSSIPTLYS